MHFCNSFPFYLQNEILDEEQQSPRYEPDPCYPRACSANEYCCPGFICVAVDDGKPQRCIYAMVLHIFVYPSKLSLYPSRCVCSQCHLLDYLFDVSIYSDYFHNLYECASLPFR